MGLVCISSIQHRAQSLWKELVRSQTPCGCIQALGFGAVATVVGASASGTTNVVASTAIVVVADRGVAPIVAVEASIELAIVHASAPRGSCRKGRTPSVLLLALVLVVFGIAGSGYVGHAASPTDTL